MTPKSNYLFSDNLLDIRSIPKGWIIKSLQENKRNNGVLNTWIQSYLESKHMPEMS